MKLNNWYIIQGHTEGLYALANDHCLSDRDIIYHKFKAGKLLEAYAYQQEWIKEQKDKVVSHDTRHAQKPRETL